MDPNACLDILDSELESPHPDGEVLKEKEEDLLEWLRKGGFEPEWQRYPAAMAFLEKKWGLGVFKEEILPSGASVWKLTD